VSKQLKKIAFLVKRADLGREDFERHWREVHGPVVSRSPDYSRYRMGYAQNHVLGDTPVGRPFPWSGMAEFWLPGDTPNEDDFSTTAIYRERIAVDERRFIDMEKTVSMTAIEHRLRPGSGPTKVVIVVGADGAATSDPGTLWAEESILRLADAVAGWTVNAVLPGTTLRPGALPSDDLEIDSVHEIWFSSPVASEALAALASLALDRLDPERTSSFLADEVVFFRDGHPVDPDGARERADGPSVP